MNILFIGHEHELNGASRSLLGMVSELSKDNSIHVLTAYKKGEFFEELKKLNIEVIYSKYFRWTSPCFIDGTRSFTGGG